VSPSMVASAQFRRVRTAGPVLHACEPTGAPRNGPPVRTLHDWKWRCTQPQIIAHGRDAARRPCHNEDRNGAVVTPFDSTRLIPRALAANYPAPARGSLIVDVLIAVLMGNPSRSTAEARVPSSGAQL